MSGGHFDYNQYKITDIRDTIERIIKNNGKNNWKNSTEYDGDDFSDDTISEFKQAVNILRKAEIYVQRIDWLVSGDDGEERFHQRLGDDLSKL